MYSSLAIHTLVPTLHTYPTLYTIRSSQHVYIHTQHIAHRRDVLRQNARKEFEEARYETDPEIINRLLVTGRDCVQQVKDKVCVCVCVSEECWYTHIWKSVDAPVYMHLHVH